MDEDQAAFIELFDEQEIGNLHVYTLPQPGNDYFFKGQPIDLAFNPLLNRELSVLTLIKGRKPEAVYRVRGKEEELYIIRMPGEEENYEIALYGWKGDKLEKMKVLSYFECKGNRCVQLESWIQDVDGDTWLDVIQKKKIIKNRGEKVKIKSTVYLMNQDGELQKSNDAAVNFMEYFMESIL